VIVYLNGRFLSLKDASISVLDRGFLYGDGVFETFRAYSGKIFMLNAHLSRLKKGLKILKIPYPDREELVKALTGVIQKNNLSDAYIRLTITRGICERGPTPKNCDKPTRFCYAEEFHGLPEELYTKGVILGISKIPQWKTSKEINLKAISFLPNILNRLNLKDKEFDSVILTPHGFISETTVCNIFFIKRRTLYTPSALCGPLFGVTRNLVIKIAKTLGIRVKEGKYSLQKLYTADEVFITNTLIEVLPVRKVGNNTFVPGPLTRKILEAYREKILQFIKSASV